MASWRYFRANFATPFMEETDPERRNEVWK